MLTAEKIQKNWQTHLKIVDTFIESSRKEKVMTLLSDLEEIVLFAPASTKQDLFNAFPGGYVDHINTLTKSALQLSEVWTNTGAAEDYTKEELVFSCLFHSLGKITDGKNEVFIPQEDEWRKKNLGEVYTYNPDVSFMNTPDRSLFILQKYGIQVSENEYLAIKLYLGSFDEYNKKYLQGDFYRGSLTNLVHILQQASILASKVKSEKS